MQGSELDDYFPSVLETVNTDYLAFVGPGILLAFSVAANGGNTGASLRHGATDKAVLRGRLMALDGTTANLPLQAPVLFPDGLFIDPDDANAYVTVEWAPLPTKLTE